MAVILGAVTTVTVLLLFLGGRDVISQQDGPPSSPAPSPMVSPVLPSNSPATASAATPGIPQQELSGGFIRYIPNRDGDIEWKMEGASVHFLSPTCLEITDLTATSVAPKIGDLTISVGVLLFYTDLKRTQADEERITVHRENMVLTGKGFLWTPDEKQIRIFEDVKFLIKEQGNQGLFPL